MIAHHRTNIMAQQTFIDALLEYDPIAEAEKLAGIGLRDDLMSLGLTIAHNRNKQTILKELGDTCFSNTMVDAIRIVEAQGFQLLLTIPFTGKGFGDEPDTPEEYRIYWNPELSALLTMESYLTKSLNMGKMYFAWEANPGETYHPRASGRWYDGKVFVGDIDIREAFVYKLNRMKDAGTFHTQWPETGWLWLLHWMDVKTEGYDSDAIIAERMAQLPEYVRQAMAY